MLGKGPLLFHIVGILIYKYKGEMIDMDKNGKYDFPLDFSSKNSLTLILSHIKPKSKVLEFGPATGRLTKYLKNKMECTIDIVEIDECSGSIAAQYANKACLGIENGDAEKNKWSDILYDEKYDYIIFAYILEHLHNPAAVLEKCYTLLNDFGNIIISVPNIANNGIIVGLLADFFNYTEVGLLDSTHIHFFTRESFKSMVEPLGSWICSEEASYGLVGKTEVATSYEMISRAAAKILKCRPAGDVYQYVFVLGKKSKINEQTFYTDIDTFSYYYSECYVLEQNKTEFHGTKRLAKFLRLNPDSVNKLHHVYDISHYQNSNFIRIDPINSNCLIVIHSIYISRETGEQEEIKQYQHNGVSIGKMIAFTTNDPQIIFSIPAHVNMIFIDFDILVFDDNLLNTFQYYI